MLLANYTNLVQNEVEDSSVRGKNVIDQAGKDTYQEILIHAARYLIAPTEEDITATPSQRYVDPVNVYSEIRKVLWKNASDDNFRVLDETTEDEYYERFVNADASTPSRYYIKANRIYFDMAPDNAGTCRVSGVEVQDELSGAVVSVIPDRFTRVMLLGMIARFKAYEGLPDALEYERLFRGPHGSQGVVKGALGDMLMDLAGKKPIKKPTLFGR